jgi:hypothetical protein
LILAVLWIGWDALRVKRLGPVEAIQLVFTRLRRLARPISGSVPIDQTATQYAFDLTKQLSSLQAPQKTQAYLSPAVDEVDQLADLYSRSLFAPTAPDHAEARGALRTWSRLRWRVLLANLFTIKNKKFSELNAKTPGR